MNHSLWPIDQNKDLLHNLANLGGNLTILSWTVKFGLGCSDGAISSFLGRKFVKTFSVSSEDIRC